MTTTQQAIRGDLEIRVPDTAGSMVVPVSDFTRATPAALLDFLQQAKRLPKEDPGRPYALTVGSKKLAPQVALSAQEVRPGSVMIIERDGEAAC